MKKSIFITIGVLILLSVLAVWLYLFTYGAPKNSDEIFAKFGLGGEETSPVVNPVASTVDVSDRTETGATQKLKQLTTRPVAGAVFIASGIRYVEQGTGHIYDIDLQSGKETLKSGTTITQATEALFSKDASYVAITSYISTGKKTIIGTIQQGQNNSGSIEGVALPLNATEVAFGSATGTINYILKNTLGSSGYAYDIKKEVSTQLFTIPLRDIHVLWGNPLYVYTTPTAQQKGSVYTVSKNNLVYVTEGGAGLVVFRYDDGIVTTTLTKENKSFFAISNTSKITEQALPFIPEKCVQNPARQHHAYCTTPTESNKGAFPDDWYKGVISYSDVLWNMDITTGIASPLSEFLTESGREIDASSIGTNETGTYIWFINKNDNTLWMFDTTL